MTDGEEFWHGACVVCPLRIPNTLLSPQGHSAPSERQLVHFAPLMRSVCRVPGARQDRVKEANDQ